MGVSSLDLVLDVEESDMSSYDHANSNLPIFDENRAEEELVSPKFAFNTLVKTTKGEDKTVMKVLLENIYDGDQIVKKELNKLVEKDKDTTLIKLKMNTGKLFENESQIQMQMVHDILRVRKEKSVDSFGYKALTELIEHPVISAFIVEKWKYAKVLFCIHIRAYMCFLGVFSFYVLSEVMKSATRHDYNQKTKAAIGGGAIDECCVYKNATDEQNCQHTFKPRPVFYEDKSSVLYSFILLVVFFSTFIQILKAIRKYKENEMEESRLKRVNIGCLLVIFFTGSVALYVDRQPMCLCSSPFLTSWDHGFFLMELLFLNFSLLFTLRKIIFLVAFRKWNNPKEILDYLALIGAYTIMAYKGRLNQDKFAKFAGGLTALGVCAAWAVFVIKMGEPRFTMFGNFITMFYSILKRTSRYFLAILFLITGFGFAFWVLQATMEKPEDEYHFNIWNFEMSAIVMSTGEFDFRDFFKDFDDKDKITVVFAMLLLFLMILFVTITMLNLLQAVIIQDYKSLMKDVYVQNLIFMSNYIHDIETLLHNCGIFSKVLHFLFPRVKNSVKLQLTEIKYCPYKLCCKECPQEKHIESHFNQIIQGFNQILKQKNNADIFEKVAEVKRKTEEDCRNILDEVGEVRIDLNSILAILQSRDHRQ